MGGGFKERLLEQSLRLLEVVWRVLAEPPQHLCAFGTGGELVEKPLEDCSGAFRIPARIMVVGREKLPAAQDLVGAIAWRKRDREFRQLGCRHRRPTQRRDL